MRTEIELRLLDQEHEVPQVRGDEPLHAGDEREPSVCRGPVMVGRRRLEQLGDLGGAPAGGRRHECP